MFLRRYKPLLPLLLIVFRCLSAQTPGPAPRRAPASLTILVSDENRVAVPGARILLQGPASAIRCETGPTGICAFGEIAGAPWRLRVEKEGFYVFSLAEIQTSGALEVVLARQQEVREQVNVTESPPAIDPEQVSSQEQLSGLDIINIPYPNTRDYRYVLGFIPGVVLDQNAQPHVAGAETSQTVVLLDGFNISQPADGQLLARVTTDALRNVDVQTGRLSAQHGKGPAGVLSLETGIGDDRYRFSATNFVPSVQNKKGWTLDKVDPRFTLSGPIRRGKMWFFDGVDGEYDNVVLPDLPAHEDTDTVWRFSNLAKLQAKVTAHDILTTSFLVNWLHDDHQGLSTLAPAATRPTDVENLYFASIKEQHAFAAETLLELGFGFAQYGLEQVPLGTAPYVLTPQGAQGNYYLHAQTTARRWQAISNLYVPRRWHGRHDFMLGGDFDRISHDQFFRRAPITSLRDCPATTPTCQPVALFSSFAGAGRSITYNTETSGYLQDRWAALPRLLLQSGIRFDWDAIVRRPLLAPRLAGTYVLDNSGHTKLSAGVGVVYQATDLSLIAAPRGGSRTDTFYDPQGNPSVFLTTFSVDRHRLLAPRFLNWSVALERKLPGQIFVKAEFLQRDSIHGFAYDSSGPGSTAFLLLNSRRDHYRAFTLDARRMFRKRYTVTASYTRSTSHSNQVIDYSLDNPVLNPQVPGPYPWDVPNRFIAWGWLPLVKGFDAGYSFEAHTGFPFAAINDQQQIVRPPGSYRFPTYLSLNFHLEKRFHALGFYWALRGGFDNLTNRQNPFTVNNNINSPDFLVFSNFDRRAFTARIRFLGRK
ncbi:MAG TPA: TonB-dependent receptor [Candidatus Sulfotelmatobacter sp.]|nr:TonB-dependent receptor [Candidatus Sulfotelmatobacter sp.]